VPAAHYAIILAGKDGIAATTEAAVQQAGFGATLAWLSQEAKIAQAEASVRQQMAGANSALDAAAVPHELGHK